MYVHISQTQQDCDLQKLFHISACVLWCEVSCVAEFVDVGTCCFLFLIYQTWMFLTCLLDGFTNGQPFLSCHNSQVYFLFNVSETGKKNPNSRTKKQA